MRGGEPFLSCASLTQPSLLALQVAIRHNTTSATFHGGWCYSTTCYPTANDALRTLAIGNVATWELGRNPQTGIYIDHVDPSLPASEQELGMASMDASGLGMAIECVAAAIGLTPVETAAKRVLQTLSSAASLVDRNANGWLPTFVDSSTGKSLSPGTFSTDSTGIFTVGALFARTYFSTAGASLPETPLIAKLATAALDAVNWRSLFCDNGQVSDVGSCIPWLLAQNASSCSDWFCPDPTTGSFFFSEMQWVAWLAYTQGGDSPSVAAMWASWQARRSNPGYSYDGEQVWLHPILCGLGAVGVLG